jgi:5-methylcytosine-specific restriction protein B
MSIYLAAQVEVYRHLLARHAQDPTFRFSLRRAFSATPTSVQGLFIGTAKSRYFAFTLWHIPIGFPGSAMELISYIIRVEADGSFRLKVEVLLPREAPAADASGWHVNTLPSRDLVWELQRQSWPATVNWFAAPSTNKMLQLTYHAAQDLADVPALLSALDATLDATIPGIDTAIAAHFTATPGWVAHRYTEEQFAKMREKVELRCADLLAGNFPPEPVETEIAYWTTQVEADPDAWLRFRQQGVVRPLFNQPSAASDAGGDNGLQLLSLAKPGDVVIVTRGPRRVLGVGLLTGKFLPDASQPPYFCSVEWLLTTPTELKGTPFITGSMVWNRTKKWATIRDAYAEVSPVALEGLEAQLSGHTLPDVKEDDAGYGIQDIVEPAHWWLNINPSYWKVNDFEVGQEQTWTTHNDKGNKRTIYKYFQQVQPGDLIIGYETTPSKRVKAILEVTEGIHLNEDEREIMTFRVKEFVREELKREQLLLMPELTTCEPLTSAQGSLFKLKSVEFTAIVTRAQRIVAPTLPPYTLAEAEQDLFLTTAQIIHLRGALKRKKNLIVQGPPGVGKTYVARRLAWLQMGEKDDNRVQLVQFHQSYSYEDFIRGWRPTEAGGFELANGVFVDFVRKAQHDQAHDYFFLIDEINRGNLSKIFGELLMLLEADKRDPQYAMPLTYRKEGEAPFYLPPNLFVVGTMNTADRSLALVDYALRRRFTFVELEPHLDGKLVDYLAHAGVPTDLASTLLERVQKLNQQIVKDRNLGTGFQIGHSYFCVPLSGEAPEAWWQAIVAHDLAPLLKEYWFDEQEGKKAASAIAALLGQTPVA